MYTIHSPDTHAHTEGCITGVVLMSVVTSTWTNQRSWKTTSRFYVHMLVHHTLLSVCVRLTVACPATAPASADQRNVRIVRAGWEGQRGAETGTRTGRRAAPSSLKTPAQSYGGSNMCLLITWSEAGPFTQTSVSARVLVTHSLPSIVVHELTVGVGALHPLSLTQDQI